MKKIILFFGLTILLTGCSSTITYDFEKDTIKSNIEISINDTEVEIESQKLYFEKNEITNHEKYIQDMIDSTSIIAFGKTEYKSDGYTKNDNNYKINYSYDFSYKTFEENYYLKNCFDYYLHTEDEFFHYYKILGKNKCNYDNIKLILKGNIINSNSEDIKNGIHSFNILKNNNEIEFVISKNDLSNKTLASKWKIVAGIVLSLLIIATAFIMKKINE